MSITVLFPDGLGLDMVSEPHPGSRDPPNPFPWAPCPVSWWVVAQPSLHPIASCSWAAPAQSRPNPCPPSDLPRQSPLHPGSEAIAHSPAFARCSTLHPLIPDSHTLAPDSLQAPPFSSSPSLSSPLPLSSLIPPSTSSQPSSPSFPASSFRKPYRLPLGPCLLSTPRLSGTLSGGSRRGGGRALTPCGTVVRGSVPWQRVSTPKYQCCPK